MKNLFLNILSKVTKISCLVLVILCIADTSTVFADNLASISGTVSDKKSKKLAFVNLVLKDGTKIITGTATDFNGEYKIEKIKPGVYTLETSYVGYKNVTKRILLKASDAVTVDFKLVSMVKLKEVIVFADVTEDLNDAEQPVIEQQQIRRDMLGKKDYSYQWKAAEKVRGGTISNRITTIAPVNISGNFSQIHNTESYSHIAENEFKQAITTPLSTFSIDVDVASYANVRRFINQGATPPADAVRIEEMINYFNYDYPQPESKHPFSITTEMSNCPWNQDHKLVHVGIQGEKIETGELPSSNLVFLLDVSGSMNQPNKLPLLKSSFTMLVNNLREEDRVAIVVYAGAAGLVLPSTPGSKKEEILSAIDRLNAGGSTAGGAGIKLAYKIAQENFIEDGNNRIILATDGDFNIGASSDGEMTRLIEEKRKTGVYITVLGFGMGNYKDSKMETIADHGNGNYAYIDNLMEAKKVLVTEMGGTLHTIAKDVKIQIEFNPAIVESYKLIGYENRLLAKEDFNDDTKDAGELGAGHTVTALYEIALKGMSNPKRDVDPLRYQTDTKPIIQSEEDTEPATAFENEIMTVKFRYKKPKSSTSILIVEHLQNENIATEQLSNNFNFSAAVAQFGMLLRNSKHKGSSTYDNVISLARKSKGKDVFGYRSEFIRMVELHELRASK